jgi:hypothetical protein
MASPSPNSSTSLVMAYLHEKGWVPEEDVLTEVSRRIEPEKALACMEASGGRIQRPMHTSEKIVRGARRLVKQALSRMIDRHKLVELNGRGEVRLVFCFCPVCAGYTLRGKACGGCGVVNRERVNGRKTTAHKKQVQRRTG